MRRSPLLFLLLNLFNLRHILRLLRAGAKTKREGYKNKQECLPERDMNIHHISKFVIFITQVSLVTSGPRRGPTFNNRWWNDRRSWNLRTTNSREKASPKGANHIQSCSCSPPSGTTREYLSLSAGSIPFGHSTRGYSHSPPSGTGSNATCETSVYLKLLLIYFRYQAKNHTSATTRMMTLPV